MDSVLQSVFCRICGSSSCDNWYNLYDSIIINERKVNFSEMLIYTTQINVFIKRNLFKFSHLLIHYFFCRF